MILPKISCFLLDVIRETLASCDYRDCNEKCLDYLIVVSGECPHVFNNDRYLELWNTLFTICEDAAIGTQTSPFFLDQ
jgi:hypothetical protein